MQRVTTFLSWIGGALLVLAGTAGAQQTIGGHDETSETNSAVWAVGPPTPGTAPALAAGHLLLTEVIVTPTPAELIEIHNPTSSPVALDQYYLTDAWFTPSGGTPVSYHLVPSGNLTVTTNTDFVVRFPSGASIPAGGTIVVAMYGPGVDSTYGAGTADFEVTSASASIPDMIHVGNNTPATGAGATTLTNGSEFVMLFYWDGLSDNVCDVDYVTWGSSSGTSRVDKTGLKVDGPDADSDSTAYLLDTPFAAQDAVTAPGSGSSVARTGGGEGAEIPSGGNGCIPGGPVSNRPSSWGKLKIRYR